MTPSLDVLLAALDLQLRACDRMITLGEQTTVALRNIADTQDAFLEMLRQTHAASLATRRRLLEGLAPHVAPMRES